jgi:hypothetical protein
VILSILAVAFRVKGYRSLARGLRDQDHPSQTNRVVRGIRGFIVSAACVSLVAGVLTGVKWLWIFGLVFLGEELLETGIMILALRRGSDQDRS